MHEWSVQCQHCSIEVLDLQSCYAGFEFMQLCKRDCVQVDNYCQSINHFGAQTLEKLHMLDGLHKARVSV